jgi:hypothetical protein
MINSNSLTALAFKLIAEKKPNNFAGTLIDTSTRDSSKEALRTFERSVAEADRRRPPVAMPLGLFRP